MKRNEQRSEKVKSEAKIDERVVMALNDLHAEVEREIRERTAERVVRMEQDYDLK